MEKIDDLILSQEAAADSFAALGSEPRLAVVLALVGAGPTGLSAAELAERTGIAGSRLTHHLRFLTQAGLVDQQRQGRQIISRAQFDALEKLSRYLLLNCCAEAGPQAERHEGHKT